MLCRRQQKKTRRGWYRCSMITYHFHIVLHFCTQSWASRLLAASCSRFFFGPCSQHNCAICVKVTNNGPLPKGTRENESKIVKIHQICWSILYHFGKSKLYTVYTSNIFQPALGGLCKLIKPLVTQRATGNRSLARSSSPMMRQLILLPDLSQVGKSSPKKHQNTWMTWIKWHGDTWANFSINNVII